MASSPQLSPRRTTSPQLAESPIINSEEAQGRGTPTTCDPMVLDSNIDHPESRPEVRTPEPQISHARDGNHIPEVERSPISPGQIPHFDWEDFESRYEQALSQANDQERELLQEFDGLVKYFNVWASASSAHDNERAVKRLQTRERFVKIAEQSLNQKKQHLTEVVRAFQSALALLSQH